MPWSGPLYPPPRAVWSGHPWSRSGEGCCGLGGLCCHPVLPSPSLFLHPSPLPAVPASPPRCLCKAASPLRYSCAPPPEAPPPSLWTLVILIKVWANSECCFESFVSIGARTPTASLRSHRPASRRLVYAGARKMGVAGGGSAWLGASSSRPQRCCVRSMRTILTNGRARLREPLPLPEAAVDPGR